MKKLLLIALLIMGCDNSTEPTDCFGIANGTAAIDDCGVCSGGTTGLDANADMDCADVCFGGHLQTAGECECADGIVEDGCGICDGNCVVGTYSLTSYTLYETSDCSGEGEEVSMTDNHLLIFNSNGTLNYDYGSGIEGQDFTWEQSENYITTTMNGLPWFSYTLSGNTLTTTQSNNGGCEQMIYTK